jgi:hypothetical protein
MENGIKCEENSSFWRVMTQPHRCTTIQKSVEKGLFTKRKMQFCTENNVIVNIGQQHADEAA